MNFAHNNVSDGFFKRFLLSIPPEKFVKRNEKKEMQNSNASKNRLDMQKILGRLFILSGKRKIVMVLDGDAERLYDEHHDAATKYREDNIYEESRVSVMSKSIGLSMRLSGVICLMRNIILMIGEEEKNEKSTGEDTDDMEVSHEGMKKSESTITFMVNKEDFKMGLSIAQYSVKTSFALMTDNITHKRSGAVPSRSAKLPVPEPENFTIDYAVENAKLVRRYLSTPSVPLSMVSRDKMYPIVNNQQGQTIGKKFVEGLRSIGLGYLSPTSKSFKRYNPDDEKCPDRDNLRTKYRLLNMELSSSESKNEDSGSGSSI